MHTTAGLDAGGAVRATEFPGVTRVDVQNLGALAPEELRDPERNKPLRKAWTARHNDALLDALAAAAAERGGSFDSFAEWTTMCGAAYDFADINAKRRARFSEAYRAAITTVFGMDRGTGRAARIHATAFVPRAGVAFERRAWRPRALYETEFMALAPAVTIRFGGAQQVFLSGVMDWDEEHRPMNAEDPRSQIRAVLRRIVAVFEEAGGSKRDVLRLRPMLPTRDCATVLQEEVAAVWPESPPVCTVWAGMPMPAGCFAEIQAYGITGAGATPVVHDPLAAPEGVTARAAHARDFEMLLAGPFGARGEPVPETARRVADFLNAQRLGARDVCTAFVLARDDGAAAAFASATEGTLDPDCLHVIRARPEEELAGASVRVELTARRRA